MLEELEINKESENKKMELSRLTNEVEVYLNPPYNWEVTDDPIVIDDYQKKGKAMVRTTNVMEVIQKIEYLCHPKVNLISQEAKSFIKERAEVMRTLVTSDWAKELVSDENKAVLSLESIKENMGEQRQYREKEELAIVRSSLQKVVATLHEEIEKIK